MPEGGTGVPKHVGIITDSNIIIVYVVCTFSWLSKRNMEGLLLPTCHSYTSTRRCKYASMLLWKSLGGGYGSKCGVTRALR
jgi:hypothetical protein